MNRRITVVTTGRQDYGILRSLILGLMEDDRFELDLWVGGMHLDHRFGETAQFIRDDGITEYRELQFLADPPDPAADAVRAMNAAVELLEQERPDALLVLGDRSETIAVALAAAILGVPLAHLHGGEESEGAIDNALRHAITKLSHLHFTTHPLHRDRVLQMGEPEETVFVVGPPGVDNLYRDDLPNRATLLESLELEPTLDIPIISVTIHPTTLSEGSVLDETRAVAKALEGEQCAVVVTMPNADAGGVQIREFWGEWSKGRPHARAVSSLGERRYWGLMRTADAMISNSSSGLIEAPAARLPVVNVGDRQKGRLRHPMTLDVPPEPERIASALRRALSPTFRKKLQESKPLYPEGAAAPRMIDVLAKWTPPDPARKNFRMVDWERT